MTTPGITSGVTPAFEWPHLTYYGGPLIPNVKVIKVLYGAGSYDSAITSTIITGPTMAGFFTGVLNSPYMDWLSEYNEPGYSIGRGIYGKSYQIIPASSRNGSSITDAQIQAEVSAQMTAGHLPQPTNGSMYMIFFPPGKTIVASNGWHSCVQFCAYHGTYKRNGQYVFYGIMPDQGGGCLGGCGTSPSKFNNTTSVTSHEMIETVTDPAVGLATAYGPPLGWYDVPNNAEIGDLCNAQQGTVVGGNGTTYTVQKEWSNKSGICKVQ
jgi:hypothetical protein